MGASHSSVMTPEELKDQVFGTVVAIVSAKTDRQLKFGSSEESHSLPLLTKQRDLTVNERQQAYSQYYNYERQYAIDNYLNAHVLNTPENVKKFSDAFFSIMTKDYIHPQSQSESSTKEVSTSSKRQLGDSKSQDNEQWFNVSHGVILRDESEDGYSVEEYPQSVPID
jgi:hypothetical protein